MCRLPKPTLAQFLSEDFKRQGLYSLPQEASSQGTSLHLRWRRGLCGELTSELTFLLSQAAFVDTTGTPRKGWACTDPFFLWPGELKGAEVRCGLSLPGFLYKGTPTTCHGQSKLGPWLPGQELLPQ